MKETVLRNKKVIEFLNDLDVRDRLLNDGYKQEEFEDYFRERYNFYRENWQSWEIECRFSLDVLLYNLKCDLGLA